MQPFEFPFLRPVLPPLADWQEDLETCYQKRWFSNFGALSTRFEALLEQRIGRTVTSCANGTLAITAALLTLPQKGRVLLPSFTFPATIQAVLGAGHQPVLVDVDPDRWELSLDLVEHAHTQQPSGSVVAVLGVRSFGFCRDWSPLHTWAQAQNILLVLDSAAALGGHLDDGTAVGNQGDMECFSLHATKVFGIGEGGLLSSSADLQSTLRSILNFGIKGENVSFQAINGKMSEFSAAIGIAQNKVVDGQIQARQQAAAIYREFFQNRMSHWRNALEPGNSPWQAFPILSSSGPEAETVLRRCADAGIQLRRYYRPSLSLSTIGQSVLGTPCPNSEILADRMLCFPMYSDWQPGEQERLLGRLDEILPKSQC